MTPAPQSTAQSTGRPAEHILVCLSASPTNARIVRTAATMAGAFGGAFTALYVRTPAADRMPAADRARLEENTRLAKSLGAAVTTVYGDDVSVQIAEFARLAHVTRIVIGRSGAVRRHFFGAPTLPERLTESLPELEIHIIPDPDAADAYGLRKSILTRYVQPSLRDLGVTVLVLAAATGIGSGFAALHFTEANIITVYILGVLVTALLASSPVCSVISSLASVLAFNFFFTEPRLTLHAYEPGYPFTFAIMLIASLMTGTLAIRLKENARQSALAAFRTNLLLDTNRLLQQAGSDDEMLRITASQLRKLLERDIIVYPEAGRGLGPGQVFARPEGSGALFAEAPERAAAQWVFANKRRAGAGTGEQAQARGLYLAIRGSGTVYGVLGIDPGAAPLDPFEEGMLLSILGECALALENSRNARAKEEAAVRAKNEKLRADLLRTISHDLRTPLTSIAGNAGYLLSDWQKLDDETRTRAFGDIYDDALWLNSVVENLLSVTRLEEGRMNLHISDEVLDDIIEEALRHIDRHAAEHTVRVQPAEELLLVRADPTLLAQVVINLVNNAVKYTPPGSAITVSTRRQGQMAAVCVADDGPGIPDAHKPRIFEMFYTGDAPVADGRRSLGLGLGLCRSIVAAHGGALTLADNDPHGCVFTFTVPLGEVKVDA